MDTLNEDGVAVKLIDARDVYDEEYPPGTPERKKMDAKLQAHTEQFGRKLRRRQRIRALPGKVKELIWTRLLRRAAG